MALPETRNTSYNATDPVLSNDLNALEDCVIGKKHGETEVAILPCGGIRSSINFSGNGYVTASAPGATVTEHPVQLEAGDVITAVSMECYGTAAGTISATLNVSRNDGNPADTYTVSISSPSASWQRVSSTASLPRAILIGESAWLSLAISETGARVGKIGIVRKRL